MQLANYLVGVDGCTVCHTRYASPMIASHECPDCQEMEMRLRSLETELSAARTNAMRWEHEAHDLRREIQRLRMSVDTERLSRDR